MLSERLADASTDSVGASLVIPQYSVGRVLLIWAAAALPMGVLGWVVAPAVSAHTSSPVLARVGVLTIGLAWQFVLVVLLLAREPEGLRWSTLRRRLWLTAPRSPSTGQARGRLWLWLAPLLVVTVLFELLAKARVDALWVSALPFVAEPSAWSLSAAFGTPELRAGLVGAWGTLGIYVVNATLNTFLGEELLFRGLLLPRMSSAFGRWDWIANGLLFGLYHLHQPWGIASSAIGGVFLYALPTRTFRSSWFGVVAHSGQSVYFTFLLLGLVLGLA